MSTPRPASVRFEHHQLGRPGVGRLGVGDTRPRLSWQVPEAPAGYLQLGYRVEVAFEPPVGRPQTSVHEVRGNEQLLVPWPARDLASRERVRVRVQVEGPDGWGPWSEPAVLETGLLAAGDWSARFVTAPWPERAGTDRRPFLVRREFTLPADARIARARLYLSAHGLAEAEVNGRRAGDEELTPGWTSYAHRLRYATFDVTDLVRPGANAIGVWLGDGWWRGRIGFEGGVHDVYGTDLAALVQLEVVTADGTRHTIAGDGGWQAGPGPLLFSGLYDGERFDARLYDPAWSLPGFAAAGWEPARTAPLDAGVLGAPTGPPVRCTEELRPVAVQDKGNGRHLLDFGQNHSGRLRLRVDGPAGTEITLRHAEVLQDGELCARPLREAAATDVLVLPGGPVEWEPRFTIHGYRYAEVSGWPGDLEDGAVVSRVLHSDMARTGWFSCSDPLVDRLHENTVWSLRSNFVDLPTDCPQRDERLGWTGDLQVFAPTAAFLYDVSGFLHSWLADVAAEQAEHGTVPLYVPWIPLGLWGRFPMVPAAVWGDVAVLTPDVLHSRTGDTEVLRRQYASARAWVEQVATTAGPDRIADKTFQLGDWLDPAAPPDSPAQATTEPGLVATAYFAHSARRLSAVAALLGEASDARRYADLAQEVAAAFAGRFVRADGRLSSDTQTAHSLALLFDLLPGDDARRAAADRLADLVRQAGGRIATGFAGTPVVTDALSSTGHVAEAYRLLQSTACPSWLYPVTMGATTVWERWDSMLPDGSVNPGDMTSFNHYALGAVADWLHRVVAGIAPDAPGYRRIRFAPRPGGTLTSAAAAHLTPYGRASISWSLDGGLLRVAVEVPPGATGVLDLPGTEPREVGHGRHTAEVALPA
ncbi:alpha-L-rhamnosidase [Kineococcus xinjiangensis]|uniref:alpha-L-rhamnosidase n=1 Tax=Kineococcus xinjiangensis TaxID=512762 RepID=A0A2S6IXI4_9ACTN|nr:glycoside hydrolase family 78 protein [Kineococcus xinjiangensis]PPK98851.1 alpha-L-rhamnosidase [Kineococcus xinjiangensis]